ncbi:ROK family protein [Streptomyces sp. NBC_00271]|uniref:ROK family protein n=1 Tax=Streptomyces sp. NBC_00271 TaxID=2975697 RepID=UPI002E285808|nr:ROK family protein [Streptomyces sp. NBC_00271]
MRLPADIPVLELGGSHVSAALVDPVAGVIRPGTHRRMPVAPQGDAREIVDSVAGCAALLPTAASAWGIALPGPFDYATGVAWYRGVGKFDALYGMDLGRALRGTLGERMTAAAFVNDAHSFLLGEAAVGAAAGHRRAVGITLGTGVGSAFLRDGRLVCSGPLVPSEGRVDLLRVDGRPLEDTISSRAIVQRFTALAGPKAAAAVEGVREVAEQARAGSGPARAVLGEAFEALGRALGPWIVGFGASVLVVGGSITGAWDLIADPFTRGLRTAGPPLPEVRQAANPRDAALVGAAMVAPVAARGHLRTP